MTQFNADDLDGYLDNVVDEFDEKPLENEPVDDDAFLASEFAKQLQSNMEELLKMPMDGEDMKQQMDQLAESMKKLNATKEAPKTLNARIHETMEQLKKSSEELPMDDAMMENMMKELEHMMDSGEFEKAMDNVMEELFSKDLMYEPMKELSIKYDDYLSKHRNTLSTTELNRYQQQHELIRIIIQKYDHGEDDQVAQLMQQMQELGQPPSEIVAE